MNQPKRVRVSLRRPKPKPVKRPQRASTISCVKCLALKRGEPAAWSDTNLKIYHENDHTWPGFAGEPDGGENGGSDF